MKYLMYDVLHYNICFVTYLLQIKKKKPLGHISALGTKKPT